MKTLFTLFFTMLFSITCYAKNIESKHCNVSATIDMDSSTIIKRCAYKNGTKDFLMIGKAIQRTPETKLKTKALVKWGNESFTVNLVKDKDITLIEKKGYKKDVPFSVTFI